MRMAREVGKLVERCLVTEAGGGVSWQAVKLWEMERERRR
jgi:hypothetical protein